MPSALVALYSCFFSDHSMRAAWMTCLFLRWMTLAARAAVAPNANTARATPVHPTRWLFFLICSFLLAVLAGRDGDADERHGPTYLAGGVAPFVS